MSDLCKNTKAVLRRVVGEDAVFLEDDPFDKLLQVIVAASIHPETAPTYTTESWVEGDSWYVREESRPRSGDQPRNERP